MKINKPSNIAPLFVYFNSNLNVCEVFYKNNKIAILEQHHLWDIVSIMNSNYLNEYGECLFFEPTNLFEKYLKEIDSYIHTISAIYNMDYNPQEGWSNSKTKTTITSFAIFWNNPNIKIKFI